MTSLLKNQILKHLSKFTKNLSSDRLNVSAIKGEGELSNLELDEDVLTDLLELPTWLKIAQVTCNRVAIKIQWTKLKSQPICLYLDEVVVEMETCETPRPPTTVASKSPVSPGGKYGFIDKVMDGIYVHINSVIIKMVSRTFNASLQPAFHQARLPCGAIAQTVAWSAPRSMALHSITASQCAFTQPPPADGPAFPLATSRPAVGSGQRPPLIQASCPTSYH
ncbi:hypothetical protein ACOMHN_010815 [Nucella lapillus]